MKALKITFLITILGRFQSTAQGRFTLSGTITDIANGEDLIGVTVSINDGLIGVITNNYGFYSITLPAGNYKITYSYIGFETIEEQIDLNEDKNISLELSGSSSVLDEVVVTSDVENENISSPEIGVVKLNIQTIKALPASAGEIDIVKSIQLLPGVTAASEGTSGFNVRGGAPDQNLILLDEGVIYNASHVFGLFSTFNPDVIKDVKIYKGGIPARYGGRLSSILDVRQKEGNSKQFQGNAGIGLISSRVLVEGPLIKQDEGSFLFSARRSYGDVFLTLIDNESTAFFYDMNLKANYKLGEKDRIYLSGYLGRDRFEFEELSTNIWGNATGTLRWNHVFNPKLFSNFSFIYSDYEFTTDDLALGAEFRREAHVENFNSKADFTYFLNANSTIEVGIGYQYYTFNPGIISPLNGSSIQAQTLDEKRASEVTLYVSNEQQLNQKLHLTYGLRFSHFRRLGEQRISIYQNDQPLVYNDLLGIYEDGEVVGFENFESNSSITHFSNWEPRAALTYMISNASSVKASYNRTYQYLHLISNTTTVSPVDVWAPSGPFLKPQEADQISLGYFKNFSNNTYEASIEVYGKQMDNVLDYVPGADIVFNNNIETEILSGEGRAYGMEIYVSKTKGRLTGWISYTLSRTERKITGVSDEDPGINNGEWYVANYDKPHEISVTGVYKLSKRIDFSANFVFASGLPTTYPTSGYNYGGLIVPQYEQRNEQRIPSYHRLDLSMMLQGKEKPDKKTSHSWVFGLYNAYNRLNANSIDFRGEMDSKATLDAIKTYVFGIVPNVTYQLKF
ncbi:MAG: TonB-dependent receptor [Bacteroidota bacterium]